MADTNGAGQDIRQYSCEELHDLALRAACAAGFDRSVAQCLADVTVEAEVHEKSAVGLVHLFDYFDAVDKRLLKTNPSVRLERPAPSILRVDANDGPMQFAFNQYEHELVEACKTQGLALLSITNAFPAGELGYYARQLTSHGVFSIIAVNSPAVMSFGGSAQPLLGTNPLCYGVPLTETRSVTVDQASSHTALANVQHYARQGAELPENWALDAEGNTTTDATAALSGALLPFGDYKGGNIAMLVELLALLGGAQSSLDAAPYYSGHKLPRIGATVVGIDLAKFPGFEQRIDELLRRFTRDHGSDVRLVRDLSKRSHKVAVAQDVIADIEQFIADRTAG